MTLEQLQNRPVARWLAAFAFWTVIVLFYSTGSGPARLELTWRQSFLFAAGQWYAWALLAPLIIRFDRALPVAQDSLLRRILFHVPASFAFTAVYIFASGWAREAMGVAREPFSGTLASLTQAWRGMFHWNVLVYWVIFGAYAAYGFHRSLREGELRTAELERLLAESRLEALRAQLHPHFLFNALNAISAHVEREPKIARRMLEQLGDLLRLTLDHCEDQEIPLEREAAFLDRYLGIQKVRFEDRLDTRVRIDPETLDAMLPTFLLQPLVENSIKHGVAARSAPGIIGVEARCEDDTLCLKVWDNGPGLPPGWDAEQAEGMGIANTRERLRRLYGASGHTFTLTNNDQGGVNAEIRLPLRRAPQMQASYAGSAR